MERVFVAESMGVSFYGKAVLKSATVWASPGRVTVLLGRNGSGKTTLFKAALGLVTREFGTVKFKEETYSRPNLHRLAKKGLFYLPDLGLLSRRRDLGSHLSILRQRYPNEARNEALPELRLNELLGKTVLEMSGGEERRAEMAVAWTRRPSVLIADEPLAGLAPKDQEVVAGVIRSMAREGTGVILSGHDVRPLLDLADEVVWMVAGTTHGLGSPKETRAHDQFRREYLGPGF